MAGLLRLERAAGIIDGVNLDFTTPTAYEPGSLQVFRNGALQDKGSYVIEVDPAAGNFSVCVAPLPPNPNVPVAAGHPGDLIDVAYRDALLLSGGGASGGLPRVFSARELTPRVCAIESLAPALAGSVDTSAVDLPWLAAEEEVPKTVTAEDIRPRIASAKEVP